MQPPEEVADAHRALMKTVDPEIRSWATFSEQQLDEVETQSELYEAYDAVRVYLREFSDACDEIENMATERGVAFEASCSINFE